MHNITIFGVTTQNVRDYFTKGLWEYTLINGLDRIVHIFF